MGDAFEVLGLPDTATCEQARKAYLKLAEVYHPDKGGTIASFVVLQAAYQRAMKMCKEPLTCDKCGGVGYTERTVGWRRSTAICNDCNGRGAIPRGGWK